MEVNTLANETWLDSLLCDFYLASLWYDRDANPLCRFVMISQLPVDLQIHSMDVGDFAFAQQVFTNKPTPMIPVSFLVHQAAHYFPVVFDYGSHTAYVFGRRISEDNQDYDSSWSVWRGPDHWKIIADLYNWNPGDVDEVCVMIRDWKQNGYDCGPTGCAVIQMCMENGIEATWSMLSECSLMNPPPMPCGHILRLNMLVAIQQRCRTGFQDYMHFRTQPPAHWNYMELDDETITHMQSGGEREQVHQLLCSLMIASTSCFNCQSFISRRVSQQFETDLKDDVEDEEDDKGQCVTQKEIEHAPNMIEGQVKGLLALIKGHKILRGTRLCRADRPAQGLNLHPKTLVKNKEMMEEEHLDHQQLSNSAKVSRKHVGNWRLGAVQCFPRTSPPEPLPAYKGDRFLRHDYNYDDYDNGPTLDMLQQSSVYSILTHPFENMGQAPVWIMWRDHGYHLLSESFQMFYLALPGSIMDHIMTVGKDTTVNNDPVNPQVRLFPEKNRVAQMTVLGCRSSR